MVSDKISQDDIKVVDRVNVEVIQKAISKIKTGKGQWVKMVNHYRDTLGISWEEMKKINTLKGAWQDK